MKLNSSPHAIILILSFLQSSIGYLGALILNEAPTLYMLFLVSIIFSIVIWLKVEKSWSDVIIICLLMTLFSSVQIIRPTTLVGWDINGEWRVFSEVVRNQRWDPNNPQHIYNTVLSITILPLIFQEISGISGFYFIKFFSNSMFGLAIYLLFKLTDCVFPQSYRAVGLAFLLSYTPLYSEMSSLARQEIAIFVFIVAFIGLVKNRYIGISAFLLFSIALMHYSSFFIFISVTGLAIVMLKVQKISNIRDITLQYLVACGVGFLWYLYVVWQGVLKGFLSAPSLLFEDIWRFLTGEPITSPGIAVLLAPFEEPNFVASILHYISKILGSVLFTLTLLGFIVAFKYKIREHTIKSRHIIFVSGFILIMIIALLSGSFASALNLSRFISVSLLFISPYIGYSTFELTSRYPKNTRVHMLRKIMISLIILSIFTFFLLQSGVLWELSGSNVAVFPLRSYWCLRHGTPRQVYEAEIFLGTVADTRISLFITNFLDHKSLGFDFGSNLRYFSVYYNRAFSKQYNYIFLSEANVKSGLWIESNLVINITNYLANYGDNFDILFSSEALLLKNS